MKKMTIAVLIAAAVLLAGTIILCRELRRAPLLPNQERPAQPVNAWQAGIKPDQRTDYGSAAERARLLERLHKEERRQRPEEGRN
jgi:hypothetical protein